MSDSETRPQPDEVLTINDILARDGDGPSEGLVDPFYNQVWKEIPTFDQYQQGENLFFRQGVLTNSSFDYNLRQDKLLESPSHWMWERVFKEAFESYWREDGIVEHSPKPGEQKLPPNWYMVPAKIFIASFKAGKWCDVSMLGLEAEEFARQSPRQYMIGGKNMDATSQEMARSPEGIRQMLDIYEMPAHKKNILRREPFAEVVRKDGTPILMKPKAAIIDPIVQSARIKLYVGRK